MTDETKLLESTDDKLVEILSTHSPTNVLWEGARAALAVKNARRMVASAKRMEFATYVIAAATVIQLILLIVPRFRR